MVCKPPCHPFPTQFPGEDLDALLLSEVEIDEDNNDYTIDEAEGFDAND